MYVAITILVTRGRANDNKKMSDAVLRAFASSREVFWGRAKYYGVTVWCLSSRLRVRFFGSREDAKTRRVLCCSSAWWLTRSAIVLPPLQLP